MRKIIIDCDPGIDDAIGLLLAAKDENTEILLMTSTFGNTDLDSTTKNLVALNKVLDINVPIYRGSTEPIMGTRKDFGYFHGENGMGNYSLGYEDLKEDEGYAWDAIYKECKKYPNEITIVTLGPLTNIAKAFLKYEDLPGLIKEMIIMGGTSTAGNEGIYGEVNFINDPDAAKIVFSRDVKKTMDGLAANDTVALTPEEINQVLDALNEKCPMLHNPLNFYNQSQIKSGANELVINDAAAMFVALDSSYETEFLPVDIETKSSISLGRSVIDRRPYSENEPNTHIVTKINKELYLKKLLNSINSI